MSGSRSRGVEGSWGRGCGKVFTGSAKRPVGWRHGQTEMINLEDLVSQGASQSMADMLFGTGGDRSKKRPRCPDYSSSCAKDAKARLKRPCGLGASSSRSDRQEDEDCRTVDSSSCSFRTASRTPTESGASVAPQSRAASPAHSSVSTAGAGVARGHVSVSSVSAVCTVLRPAPFQLD